MRQARVYRLQVVAGGVLAEAPAAMGEWAEVVEAARRLVAGLGGRWAGWQKVAPGVAVMQGPEHGGWCVVLLCGWVGWPEAEAKPAKRPRKAKAAAERETPEGYPCGLASDAGPVN